MIADTDKLLCAVVAASRVVLADSTLPSTESLVTLEKAIEDLDRFESGQAVAEFKTLAKPRVRKAGGS